LSFEAVFMPYMLTADGRTVIERIAETSLLPPPETPKIVSLKAGDASPPPRRSSNARRQKTPARAQEGARSQRTGVMNNITIGLDPNEEDGLLTYEISDEVLEERLLSERTSHLSNGLHQGKSKFLAVNNKTEPTR
jgi:hypothetical protein